jgi:hypothetical protein
MTYPIALTVSFDFSSGPSFDPPFQIGISQLGIGVLGGASVPSQVVDLTSQSTAITIRRGRDLSQDRFNAGLCTVRVLDPNGDWNPQNPASPYFGLLQPLRKLVIVAEYLGVDYPLFAGYTTAYNYTYPKNEEFGYIDISATDAFTLFNKSAITTVTGASAGDTTGDRINQILDEIGFPSSQRQIDTGDVTVQTDPGTLRSVLQALHDVEFTEFGGVYMSPDGKVVFRERTDAVESLAGNNTYLSRTNLILNPSLETTLNGWTANNSSAVVTRNISEGFYGTSSGQVEAQNSSSVAYGARLATNATYRIPVVEGQILTASAMVKNLIGNRNIRLSCRFYVNPTTTTIISTINGTAVTNPTTWTKVSVTATAPATALWADILVNLTNTGNTGDTFVFDGVICEYGNVSPQSFFDGDNNPISGQLQSSSYWLGTPGNSRSELSFLTTPIKQFNQTTGIPYKDIKFSFSDQLIFNVANFTRVGGTTQSAFNQSSIDTYFPHTITRENLLHQNDETTLDLAKAYVANRSSADIRIDAMVLDLTTPNYDDGISAALGLGFFDPVEISNIQPAGSTLTKTLQVFGVNHQITPNSWNTTLITGDPLIAGFIIGNGKYGIIGVSTL